MSAEQEQAARSLLEVMPRAMRTLGMEMRQLGPNLPPGHVGLLKLLSRGPHRLTELAGHHAVSAPTMSKTVTTLAERGWVERVRDPQDRRSVMIQITPDGRAMLAGIDQRLSARVAAMCAPLSAAECQDLQRGLEIIRRVFSRDLDGDDNR